MSRDIQKMGWRDFDLRGIPFSVCCGDHASRRMNFSGRATYKKWDGATSTSAASHFSYDAALHAKLHQPDPDPGIRNPGGRDPFPWIRILGRGPMGGGPGRSPWPGAGLNGPELRAEPRARAPGSHARASGSLF